MAAPSRSNHTFLLTGVTGFLGKVMLEELLRRRIELGMDHVVVLIRPLRGLGADARFQREVAGSPCLADLPAGWTQFVTVIEGNVEHEGLGLSAESLRELRHVTHVIHAAASVQFDLPIAAAARANISASLNTLALGRTLPRLARFTYVSTAYATPARNGAPVLEQLVSLPDSARALYEECLQGRIAEKALLARTGHPNTYTFTKAVAEHLLVEECGDVPVSIVRPSVITASRAYPFPAWIDSTAGFAAFVMLIGAGHLRALVCKPDAQIDVIPVDEVSHRVLHAALHDVEDVSVRHAVVGLTKAPTLAQCWDATQRFFRAHPVDRRPGGRTLGPRGLRFGAANLVQHVIPATLASRKSKLHRRQAEKRSARISYLNEEFAYFTTRSFDFRTSVPMDAAYDGVAFVNTIARGVYRHLLKRDDATWTLAGHAHAGHGGDARWVMSQPSGNAWIRLASLLVTKVFRRAVDSVTVDVASFERALADVPRDATLVITPSHRSYLDFVLCSYLGFARPDLLPVPHIAATMDFARVPVLGRLLRGMHAFYLRRGGGKDPQLAGRVKKLLDDGHTLAFFIEGARSRTGSFLPPKRGLLRCLQETGRECALLPIAVSYERVPEQATFDRELGGLPRPTMRLRGLLQWTWSAWRGGVDLGNIHIVCGAPVLLDAESDVHEVSHAVIGQLRAAMTEVRRSRTTGGGPRVDADVVVDSDEWATPATDPLLAGANSAP